MVFPFAVSSRMRSRLPYHQPYPLHIVGRSLSEVWPTHIQLAWDIFQDAIADLENRYFIKTHAFVLMRNHYHWLCTLDSSHTFDVFEWFHELLNTQFLYQQNLVGTEGYTLPESPQIHSLENCPKYKEVYKYVYKNPVTAGIVARAQDYNYSSLKYILNGLKLEFPILDNMNLINDPVQVLDWINETPQKNNNFEEINSTLILKTN